MNLTRLERLGIALMLLCSGPSKCGKAQAISTTDTVTVLHGTPQFFHSLALIYREFRTEFVGCFYGQQRNDTLSISIMVPADLRPMESFRWGTGPATCVGADTFLGVVHTHPDGICQQPVFQRNEACQPDRPKVNQCQQGPADDVSFTMSGHRWAIIVCGLGELLLFDSRIPSGLVATVNGGPRTMQRRPALWCHYNIDLPEPRCSPPGTGL